MARELTVDEKVHVVAGCDDIMTAVRMLIVLMDDADLKSHVSIDYELHGEKYLLDFRKLTNKN